MKAWEFLSKFTIRKWRKSGSRKENKSQQYRKILNLHRGSYVLQSCLGTFIQIVDCKIMVGLGVY